uniref:Uncharacterized protein n=1 Tax=Hyaloperonospora arabidopsidis (strain Emoy2) TaxID=559515 RepID=M4C366_HYAAE
MTSRGRRSCCSAKNYSLMHLDDVGLVLSYYFCACVPHTGSAEVFTTAHDNALTNTS